MNILAEFLGIKMGDDCIEDARGAVLDGANHAEQDPVGDATPRAVLRPCLAFERLFVFDLAGTQGACGQARALGAAPPSPTGQGKPPQQGLIFIEEDDLALTCPILQGGPFEMRIGQIRWVRIEPASRTTVT
jgi:hypothetical protein